MGENPGVYTPSEMSFLTAGEADPVRWCLDKRHPINRQQRNELGLEVFDIRAPGGESQEISHLENLRTWTLK